MRGRKRLRGRLGTISEGSKASSCVHHKAAIVGEFIVIKLDQKLVVGVECVRRFVSLMFIEILAIHHHQLSTINLLTR